MIQLVSDALMDETWRRVAVSPPITIRRMQKQCGKDHEELTGFMLAFTSDLRPEALGVALYVHLVVSQAFRFCGARFRRIRPGRIESAWAANARVVDHLREANHPRAAIPAEATESAEPAVMRYILDALTESDDDPAELSDEEFWHAFRVLKTVTDCLHDAGLTKESAV